MSLFDSSVPAFVRTLTSLSAVLDKAEAHAKARRIQPDALLGARLFPDMFPLTLQIQHACDLAGRACARLAQVEIPITADTETTFAELKQRIGNAIAYVRAFKRSQFDGAETRNVTVDVGAGQPVTLSGQRYLSNFALPSFYFHATTAYDILRHNGVELGKRDFLGDI